MTPEAVVAAAREWVGTPYRHRAAERGLGCDCIGLLRGVWRELTGAEPAPLPPYRADGRDAAEAAVLLALAGQLLQPAPIAPGAVLLFRIGPGPLPRHCGIALPGNRFVHAQEGLGVVEGNLTAGWQRRVTASFRFPG